MAEGWNWQVSKRDILPTFITVLSYNTHTTQTTSLTSLSCLTYFTTGGARCVIFFVVRNRQQREFKSWMRLFASHTAIIPLGKVWIQLFSHSLWTKSRADWALILIWRRRRTRRRKTDWALSSWYEEEWELGEGKLTGLSHLGMKTGLGEGKLLIQNSA